MAKNKSKQKHMSIPLEEHNTASWSNIEHLKAHSRAPIPNDIEVKNAKEWVDTNQK